VGYNIDVKSEWDERKNETNLAKHSIDFADAPRIFASALLVALDEREDYGENRWIGIGLLDERVVVLVYTEPAEETIRILIGAQGANP
jgi:uncharacterized DUF497 family protein